jgi:hypothetical protein
MLVLVACDAVWSCWITVRYKHGDNANVRNDKNLFTVGLTLSFLALFLQDRNYVRYSYVRDSEENHGSNTEGTYVGDCFLSSEPDAGNWTTEQLPTTLPSPQH